MLNLISGVFAFHLCQVHHEALGSQITATQTDPVYEMQPFDGYPTLIGKAVATLENVHTGNQGSSGGDENTLKLQFQALMMNPEIADGSDASNFLKDGQDYYITAGVEYGQEGFIWTGMAQVTTSLQALVSRTERFARAVRFAIWLLRDPVCRNTTLRHPFTLLRATRRLRKGIPSCSCWRRSLRHRWQVCSLSSNSHWVTL